MLQVNHMGPRSSQSPKDTRSFSCIRSRRLMSGSTVRHRAGDQRTPNQHNKTEGLLPLANSPSNNPRLKVWQLATTIGADLRIKCLCRMVHVVCASPHRMPFMDVASLSRRMQDNGFTATIAFVHIDSSHWASATLPGSNLAYNDAIASRDRG